MNGPDQVFDKFVGGVLTFQEANFHIAFAAGAQIQRLLQLFVAVTVAHVRQHLTHGTNQAAGVGTVALADGDQVRAGAVDGLKQGITVADQGNK